MNLRSLKKKAENLKPNTVYVFQDDEGRFEFNYSVKNYDIIIESLKINQSIDNVSITNVSNLLSDIVHELNWIEENSDF